IHSTRYADVLRAHPDAIEIPPWQFEQGLVRVAEDGDGVAGFAVSLPPAEGACELDAIFVEPDRMRTGVGRLLIDDAVARARGWGANRIEVVANPDAVDFYERVGFALSEIVATRFGPGRRMRLLVDSSLRRLWRPRPPGRLRVPALAGGAAGARRRVVWAGAEAC